ncbi:MAG: hypothetical protein LQ343_003281 [Gyalolechia ehrenbergii]|nr:MAG: hypothetical protein LQ343_003281 [Gyalolechia ehrenbergii]
MSTAYTAPQKQPPNQAIGTDIIGGWTGTYYKKVIDGKTHSWAGNPPRIFYREAAIQFAQKQGYEYFVQEPNERKMVPKAYANNFLYSPKRLKKIPTK